MTVISVLLDEIKKETEAQNEVYTSVPDIDMVILGFTKLDAIIGNEKVKVKAVKQFRHILVINAENAEGKYVKSYPMMNTCLFGDPGTGKTTISECLALIWAGSGALSPPDGESFATKSVPKTTSNEGAKTSPKTTVIIEKDPLSWMDFLGILIIMGTIIYLIFAVCRAGFVSGLSAYRNYGGILVLVALMVFIFISVILYYILASQTYPNKELLPSMTIVQEKKVYKPKVVLASRGSFVGQHLGETEKKTVDFLNANRGNVVVLDEAYSLLQDDRDVYGKQAAAEIVKFLSENPHALVFILIGYESDLMDGLFRIQKGMERRFLWKFYCEGYSPEQIYDIFHKHATDRGYTIRDQESRQLVIDNSHLFKNYGGDCARLFDYSQQEYSECYLNKTSKGRVLTNDMIKVGLDELRYIADRHTTKSSNSDQASQFLESIFKQR